MIRFASSEILPDSGKGTASPLSGGVVEGPLGQVIPHRSKRTPSPLCPRPGHSTTLAGGPPPRDGEDRRWRPGRQSGLHTELFASADEASGAALALAFAHDCGDPHNPDKRPWLWVQDKTAIRQSGRPYRPGLPAAMRHRLIHVAADKAQDALFALEEGLRCRDLAFVIGEIAGNPAALDFTASRRLSLVSARHGVPLWLVRLAARHDLGSARMRWDVASAPSPPPQWNAQGPGDPRWQADLFRAHVFQPGLWMLGHDGRSQALTAFAPDHGGVVPDAADRSLAAEQSAEQHSA